MKKCTKCRQLKDESEFKKSRRSKDGTTRHCKACHNLLNRAWAKNNPEKIKESNKRWQENNTEKINESARERYDPERNRNKMLKARFGLDANSYGQMLVGQNYKCAICNIDQDKLNYRLCVDHDHNTGKVRKLLCKNCNLVIGNSLENINILNNAIEYLKEFNSFEEKSK